MNYVEDGQKKSATGKIIKLENGKNGIGISLIDRTEVTSNTPIEFSTAGIGGPSAGLMFSLAIYTQIADPTLRDGRNIAGTGSIDREGKVGDIGGIDKKLFQRQKMVQRFSLHQIIQLLRKLKKLILKRKLTMRPLWKLLKN